MATTENKNLQLILLNSVHSLKTSNYPVGQGKDSPTGKGGFP
jgi:hypothetical protein